MIFRNQITFCIGNTLAIFECLHIKIHLCFILERMWGEMVLTYTDTLGVP